ncbi:MAG: hypothetical protein CMI54_02655 [Parcubacteria group bacterium]|nr:hypothetical protein [Parcubacteria group bacterium]
MGKLRKLKFRKGDLLFNKKTGTTFLLIERIKNGGRYFWSTLTSEGESRSFYEKNLRHRLTKSPDSNHWHLIKKIN